MKAIDLGIGINVKETELSDVLSSLKNVYRADDNRKDIFLGNYNYQYGILSNKIYESLEKDFSKLERKWDISDMYLISEDAEQGHNIRYDISETVEKEFKKIKEISDLNNDKFLKKLKSVITKDIINKYEDEISTDVDKQELVYDNEKAIKTDIKKCVDKCVDKIAKKLLNDDSKEELQDLCEEWNEAYNNKDYDSLSEIAEEITDIYDNGLYRGKNLRNEAKDIIIKSEIINNKIKDGDEGIINKYEAQLIKKLFP